MMQLNERKMVNSLFIKSFLCLAIIILLNCAKKESETTITTETTHELTQQEMTLPAKVDYKALMPEIDSLQNFIQMNPTLVEPRIRLLAIAMDTSANLFRTVGRGVTPVNARTPLIGRQAAQRAAMMDAARWAGYLAAWREDVSAINFGTIDSLTIMPGHLVEASATDSSNVIVLVETSFNKIQ